MGEDTDTRKINHSFLRDHNYVTEGNRNTVVILFSHCIFCARNVLSRLEICRLFFLSCFFFFPAVFQGVFLCDVATESV